MEEHEINSVQFVVSLNWFVKMGAGFFFQEFFKNSVIHGFSYLVNPTLTFLERVLWFLLEVVALTGCVIISLQSLDRFRYKSTVITLEKDYYYWNTSLPSLTICPMQRLDRNKFDDYYRSRGINVNQSEEIFQFLESLANSSFFNFQNIKVAESVEDWQIDPKDYMATIYNFTQDLTLIEDIGHRVRTTNNLEFIYVQQILTEYGICYLTNSYLSKQLSAKLLILGEPSEESTLINEIVHRVRYGNIFDGGISYNFIGFQSQISIFIHGPYETMDIGRNYHYTSTAVEYEVWSQEIVASESFGERTDISQRGCRFPHESNLTYFKHVYTKNLCQQECRMQFALEKCKCIPHFYPNRHANVPVCSYKILMTCFPQYQDIFLTFRNRSNAKVVINCPCLQNCQDTQVIVEKIQILENSESFLGGSGGLVVVEKYPVARLKRQILFTFTDLLVSIGGTLGLFLGFNVLGAVEIIYYFSLHMACTFRSGILRR